MKLKVSHEMIERGDLLTVWKHNFLEEEDGDGDKTMIQEGRQQVVTFFLLQGFLA